MIETALIAAELRFPSRGSGGESPRAWMGAASTSRALHGELPAWLRAAGGATVAALLGDLGDPSSFGVVVEIEGDVVRICGMLSGERHRELAPSIVLGIATAAEHGADGSAVLCSEVGADEPFVHRFELASGRAYATSSSREADVERCVGSPLIVALRERIARSSAALSAVERTWQSGTPLRPRTAAMHAELVRSLASLSGAALMKVARGKQVMLLLEPKMPAPRAAKRGLGPLSRLGKTASELLGHLAHPIAEYAAAALALAAAIDGARGEAWAIRHSTEELDLHLGNEVLRVLAQGRSEASLEAIFAIVRDRARPEDVSLLEVLPQLILRHGDPSRAGELALATLRGALAGSPSSVLARRRTLIEVLKALGYRPAREALVELEAHEPLLGGACRDALARLET